MDKKRQNHLIQLHCPFQSISSLIPSGVDIGIQIEFVDGNKYFITQTNAKPRLKIIEAKLYIEVCLLKPQAILKIHQRLANGTLQLPFVGDVNKTYSIEVGHLQTHINISLKDPFEQCLVILHRNLCLIGDYKRHYQKWERHKLKSCFLESSLNVKLPSIPAGNASDMPGYQFDTPSKTRASYFVAMDQLGKFNENGVDLSMSKWLDSHFCLPFRLSPELAHYGPDLSEKILQKPILPNNARYNLFMEFETTTEYVIRVTVLYKQARIIALNSSMQAFKSFDIDQ